MMKKSKENRSNNDNRKNWQLKMHEQRNLRNKGTELLFERASLLVECFTDPDYVAWHAEHKTDAIEFLDSELSDTGYNFFTIQALMDRYPLKEQWVKHNVRELAALLKEEEQAKKKTELESKDRLSWKQRALNAETEIERLRAEVSSLKESLAIVGGARA